MILKIPQISTRHDKAFSLWLACHTQEEIAGAVDVPRQTITDWTDDFAEKLAADKSAKWTDFDPPIYNIWKQQGIPPRADGSTWNQLVPNFLQPYSPTRAREHPVAHTIETGIPGSAHARAGSTASTFVA